MQPTLASDCRAAAQFNERGGVDAGRPLCLHLVRCGPRRHSPRALAAMRTTSFITILALACIAVSCKKPTSADIAGRYTAERPHGFESLELGTNGTYVQVFTNSTVARSNAGQWTFQPPILTLKGALLFDDGFGRPATPVVTNDWKLKVRYLINIWLLEDRQNEPFSQVTSENQ